MYHRKLIRYISTHLYYGRSFDRKQHDNGFCGNSQFPFPDATIDEYGSTKFPNSTRARAQRIIGNSCNRLEARTRLHPNTLSLTCPVARDMFRRGSLGEGFDYVFYLDYLDHSAKTREHLFLFSFKEALSGRKCA